MPQIFFWDSGGHSKYWFSVGQNRSKLQLSSLFFSLYMKETLKINGSNPGFIQIILGHFLKTLTVIRDTIRPSKSPYDIYGGGKLGPQIYARQRLSEGWNKSMNTVRVFKMCPKIMLIDLILMEIKTNFLIQKIIMHLTSFNQHIHSKNCSYFNMCEMHCILWPKSCLIVTLQIISLNDLNLLLRKIINSIYKY